eukprot:g12663.t1
MANSLGMPAKILHESIGHTVTVEIRDGRTFRGHLMSCEDNFNCMLEGVTVTTGGGGAVTVMEQVAALKNAFGSCPMFGSRGQGYGRGTIAPLKGAGKGKGKFRGKTFAKKSSDFY